MSTSHAFDWLLQFVTIMKRFGAKVERPCTILKSVIPSYDRTTFADFTNLLLLQIRNDFQRYETEIKKNDRYDVSLTVKTHHI